MRGGCHAWVAPHGGWGHSNAGLVVGRGESMLVDTLFDRDTTRRMLDQTAPLVAGAPVSTLVNTHGNGDHWFGNDLVGADVRIVAATGTDADMRAVAPATVQALLEQPTDTGDYVRTIFGDFDFTGLTPRYADTTFEQERVETVGGVEVRLIDVGPAHTRGDTVVHVERDGVVFVGDLLFAGGTPIMWEGPVDNWLAASRRILELGADLLVPGHGPVSPVERLQDMCDYLEFVREQAAPRRAAGMSPLEAALDIDLGRFAGWPEAERLAANLTTVYRELSPDDVAPATGPEMFGCMAALFEQQRSADD